MMDMKKKYKKDVSTLRSVPGIKEVPGELKKQGVKIGILSSNYEVNIQQKNC